MNSDIVSLINSTVLTFGVLLGLWLAFRYVRIQELRNMHEAMRAEDVAKAGPSIVIQNSNADSEKEKEEGFQFFEVNENQKKTFVDAFNGFKEYAELRGYNVDVLIDASRDGSVGVRITIRDAGVTVSTSQVRADVNDYIRKMRDGDDLSDMPPVVDPIEHSRLMAAIKMRFDFIRHQADMNATAAEAYRTMLLTVTKQSMGGISYLPAPPMPTVHVQIGTDGGHAVSGTYSATHSPGAAVGTNNQAGIIGSAVTIGATPVEREQQTSALEQLIAQIRLSPLGSEQKEEAVRNLSNVKDEVKEDKADKGRIAKWLNRAREIIKVGAAGAELVQKGEEVFSMFGGS